MKPLSKKIIPKGVKAVIRSLRKFYFIFLDFLGEAAFGLLRFLGMLPKAGTFAKDGINKILIIRLDRIGDMILSTPAIRAARENFPQAEIHLLLNRYTKDLVVNNPSVNKLLIYGKDGIDKNYDLAMAFHPGFAQNYLTFRSGAKYRLGYSGWGGGFFLTHKIPDDRETRIRHEVESALEITGLIGCSTRSKSLDISITDEGERFANIFFKNNKLDSNDKIIIIHPGARQEYIRWKKEGFAEVADKLISEEKASVILTGAEEEGKLVNEVASMMKNKSLLALGLKLTQLISLIKRCRLFIGNSTGPMHIAAALKVPVVAIFGNTHPLDSYQEWGPWGEGHKVISLNLNCPACHPGDCYDYKCMELITAKEVFKAAQEQLGK